jgi:hypothetical protein
VLCSSTADFCRVLSFGQRHIVEDEKFFLAVSTDESPGIDSIEFGGESIGRLLSAMGARQHGAF